MLLLALVRHIDLSHVVFDMLTVHSYSLQGKRTPWTASRRKRSRPGHLVVKRLDHTCSPTSAFAVQASNSLLECVGSRHMPLGKKGRDGDERFTHPFIL